MFLIPSLCPNCYAKEGVSVAVVMDGVCCLFPFANGLYSANKAYCSNGRENSTILMENKYMFPFSSEILFLHLRLWCMHFIAHLNMWYVHMGTGIGSHDKCQRRSTTQVSRAPDSLAFSGSHAYTFICSSKFAWGETWIARSWDTNFGFPLTFHLNLFLILMFYLQHSIM